MAPHLLVLARCRPLEREDRLLLVADGEQGAGEKATRTGSGGELRHKLTHDPPLLFAGVLRLVDQDVIEAEIEFVMHPAWIDLVEHGAGLVDEVFIVEKAAAILVGAVAGDHLAGERDQRRGTVAADDGAAACDQRLETRLLGVQPCLERRILPRERPGDNRRSRLALFGEEHVEIRVRPGRIARSNRFVEARGLLLVPLASLAEGRRNRGPFRRRQMRPIDDLFVNQGEIVRRIDAEHPRELRHRLLQAPGGFEPSRDRLALADGFLQLGAYGRIGGAGHGMPQGPAERAVRVTGGPEQDRHDGTFEHLLLSVVVEHRKAGCNIGLERKLLQQPGAEGVDRLHLETARRLERGGE